MSAQKQLEELSQARLLAIEATKCARIAKF